MLTKATVAGLSGSMKVLALAAMLTAPTAIAGSPDALFGIWRDGHDPGAWIEYRPDQRIEWLDGRRMSASPIHLRSEPDGNWVRFADDPELGEQILSVDGQQLRLRRAGIDAEIELQRLLDREAIARGQRPALRNMEPPPAGGCATLISGHAFRASSTLAASARADYDSLRLLDGRIDTAWVEGVDGDGVGESLRLDLGAIRQQRIPDDGEGLQPIEGVALQGLRLVNGYPRSDTLYQANGRVASLQITLDDHEVGDWKLIDSPDPQAIAFDPPLMLLRDQVLRLSLAAIIPGQRWADTAIAELQPIIHGCAQILAVD